MSQSKPTDAPPELLPCPLCEQAWPKLEVVITEATIRCLTCGLTLTRKHTNPNVQTGKGHVIEAWNTRAPSAPAAGQGEATLPWRTQAMAQLGWLRDKSLVAESDVPFLQAFIEGNGATKLPCRAATLSSPAPPYVMLAMDNVEFQQLENMLRDYRTEASRLGGPSGTENAFIERVLNEGQRALNTISPAPDKGEVARRAAEKVDDFYDIALQGGRLYANGLTRADVRYRVASIIEAELRESR